MPVGVTTPAIAAEIAAPFESCETSQIGGNFANGCYGEPGGSFNQGGPFDVLRVQHLPALTRLQLDSAINPTIHQLGPQEYKTVLSLSRMPTVQLNLSYADNLNNPSAPVSPAVPAFVYTSRNIAVATVSPTGLVTAAGLRGECIILCSSVRCANASIAGSAVPPAGETGTEIYLELRCVVVA